MGCGAARYAWTMPKTLHDLVPGQAVQGFDPGGRTYAVIVGGGVRDLDAYLGRACVTRTMVWTQADLEAALGPHASIREALIWARSRVPNTL